MKRCHEITCVNPVSLMADDVFAVLQASPGAWHLHRKHAVRRDTGHIAASHIRLPLAWNWSAFETLQTGNGPWHLRRNVTPDREATLRLNRTAEVPVSRRIATAPAKIWVRIPVQTPARGPFPTGPTISVANAIGFSGAGRTSRPFGASVRREETWFALRPCRRATSFTVTFGRKLSDDTFRTYPTRERRQFDPDLATGNRHCVRLKEPYDRKSWRPTSLPASEQGYGTSV
jgi:hypothetical protein